MKKTIFLLLLVLGTATQTAVGQEFQWNTPATTIVPGTKPSTDQVVVFPAKTSNNVSHDAAVQKVQNSAPVRPQEYGDIQTAPAPTTNATTVIVNGNIVEMKVKRGKGQIFSGTFTPIAEQYYIQFGVYCKDIPTDGAPPIEGVMLIWHPGSKCPGWVEGDEVGAIRLVKGFATEAAARAAMAVLKDQGIETAYKGQIGSFEILATN